MAKDEGLAEHPVRRLSERDEATAVAILDAAFFPMAVSVFLFPDPARRADVGRRFFAVIARLALRHGQVFGIGDPPVAVALWYPPGCAPSEADEAAAGIGEVEALLIPEERERSQAVGVHVGPLHKRVMGDMPHGYLAFLGVHPEHQRRGLGSRLVRHLLEQLPAGVSCYLQTASAVNLPLYERLGFQVIERVDVPGTALRFWGLRRD